MNKKELIAKLNYVLAGLQVSKEQKQYINNIFMNIINIIYSDSEHTINIATDNSIGGIKIGYTSSGKNYGVQLDNNGKAYVNVPWTDNDTIAGNASTTTPGLVKQSETIENIDGAAELSTVISSFNTLVNNLKTAGIIKN